MKLTNTLRAGLLSTLLLSCSEPKTLAEQKEQTKTTPSSYAAFPIIIELPGVQPPKPADSYYELKARRLGSIDDTSRYIAFLGETEKDDLNYYMKKMDEQILIQAGETAKTFPYTDLPLPPFTYTLQFKQKKP